MLKTQDLIDSFNLTEREKYKEMLKQVNIPDFTKCIAQFSGLKINEVKDDIIAEYLKIWAKNKYQYWKMLGKQLRIDKSFTYNKFRDDICKEINSLRQKFPAYYHWLTMIKEQKQNKIDDNWIGYDYKWAIRDLFPNYSLNGVKITHFFKNKINAPDKLVTELASIFENDKIDATFTLSIDPVDMMLASENPYDWNSCYRLEIPNESSHADGCLAAILDSSTLIDYVWKNEGKFTLYDKYEFKSIRFKMMRQWIAIEPKNMRAVHFNSIYPGKSSYGGELYKQFRDVIETIITDYLGAKNMWHSNDGKYQCYREFPYGYDEYDEDYIYWRDDEENFKCDECEWTVFNEEIPCPKDGLNGIYLKGLGQDDDDDGEYRYTGWGFIAKNITKGYWCELRDDWCPFGHDDCETCCECECSDWNYEHPTCDLDGDECLNPDYEYINDGTMESCKGHCADCSHWQCYYAEPDDDEE